MTTGAAADWYPDPDDPSALRYWDGTAWTEHRAPAPQPAAAAPAPAPVARAPVALPPVAQTPVAPVVEPPPYAPVAYAPVAAAPARRSRLPLLAGIGIAAVVAVVAALLLLPGDDDDPLRFDGRTIAEPEEVIDAGEDALDATVEARNGALADAGGCWFSRASEDAADVSPFLRCGPVLFIDGDEDEPWLSYPLSAGGGEGDATLSVGDDPVDPEPSALDAGEILLRPDDRAAPEGNGGLEVPLPPRGEPGLVLVQDEGDFELVPVTEGGVMMGATRSISVGSVAQLDRVGSGDDAFRAAEGEELLGVQISVASGVIGPPGDDLVVTIEVEGNEPVPAPEELDGELAHTFLLLSVPEGAEADIVMVDSGVEQRLSLRDGSAGADNIVVMTRGNVTQTLTGVQTLGFTGTVAGVGTFDATVTITATQATLGWFLGTADRHPDDPAMAWLFVEATFVYSIPGLTGGLGAGVWHLGLPDGTTVEALNLADDPAAFINIAFLVPGDFTEGTVTISGVDVQGDTTIDLGANVMTVPLSIPPG